MIKICLSLEYPWFNEQKSSAAEVLPTSKRTISRAHTHLSPLKRGIHAA